MSSQARCTACARVPRGAFWVSLRGEVTCTGHGAVGHCTLCGRARTDHEQQAWRTLNGEILRCPTCRVGAVENATQLRAHLPRVRADLRRLGVTLPERVRVHLSANVQLEANHAGSVLGVTHLAIDTRPRHADVVGIRIVGGLPPIVFGHTLAHEATHGWLAQMHARPDEHAIEEGVCVAVEHAWLGLEGSRFATALRLQMRTNRDPIYGDGFRVARQSVRTHGLPAVLGSLRATGRLPR